MKAVKPFGAKRVGFQGSSDTDVERAVASEVPIAFEINGLAYAVMMASPADIEDFAIGFVLSEGMVESPEGIAQLDIAEIENGIIVRMMIPDAAEQLEDRIRLRLSEGSCGLCGVRSIEDVLRPLPRLEPGEPISRLALERALDNLHSHQPMGQATGAMHAAAACTREGEILLVREDVGRHNALDKLIGAMARQQLDPADGFFLLSARCSFELVEKTVRAGCATLVTISAPTSLAVERACEAGLTLYALARSDSALRMHAPDKFARDNGPAILRAGEA